MRKLATDILELIFPTTCMGGCKKRGIALCSECLYGLPHATAHPHEHIWCAYTYNHPVCKHAIHELKKRPNADIAEALAQKPAEYLIELIAERKTFGNTKRWFVTGIPLSKAQKKERGFNQAELIAGFVAERLSGATHIPSILDRIRETQKQAFLSDRTERLANAYKSMQASDLASGRNVIVIDDVSTTGGTLLEARRALTLAGARDVITIAIAH